MPNEVFTGSQPAIGQIINVALQEKCSVVAVREVAPHEVSRFSIIDIKRQFSPTLFQVRNIVEKPSPINAPSHLAIVGRYVLAPAIFNILEQVGPDGSDEIPLSDGIRELIESGEKVFAYKVSGSRHDVSSPIEWLKSTIELALSHPSFSEPLMEYLQALDRDLVVMSGKAQALKMREKSL